MNKKLSLLSCMLVLCGVPHVALAAPADRVPVDYSGVQLRQMQEQIERERIERQMQEQREKSRERVEDRQQKPSGQAGTARFVLKAVETDASQILPPEKRDEVVAPYVGKEVSLDDLYEIVEKINRYYKDNGWITCCAYLPPQTIHDGHVRIAVIEGKTGQVTVTGNRHTRDSYVKGRLGIRPGSIENTKSLDRRIHQAVATDDLSLTVTLKAGKEPKTTDYEIVVLEPKNQSFMLYADGAGNESTGRWRAGAFYSNRSLFKIRDHLNLGYLHAKGMDSFSAGYSVPLGYKGTRLALDYNTNSSKVVKGAYHDQGIPVKGHAYSFTATLTHPLHVTEKVKVEALLSGNYQHSVTDIAGARIVSDTFKDVTAGVAVTHYGGKWGLYQKHSVTFGNWDNDAITQNTAGASSHYTLYNFMGLYQYGGQAGQLFNLRTSAQWSGGSDLRSSRQFYLGGSYSVRGYEENVISGNGGFCVSAEYAVPVTKDRVLSLYEFVDYGSLFGEDKPRNHTLLGVGAGIRARFKNTAYLDLAVGFPLKRKLDGDRAGRSRIHLSANVTF